MDEAANLIKATADLVNAAAWPLLLLFVIFLLRRAFGGLGTAWLQRFLANLSEFSFKAGAGGVEATARRAAVSGALIAKAEAARSGEADGPAVEPVASEIGALVARAEESMLRDARPVEILWVDDRPANNRFEMDALEALGFRITTSLSTDDALKKLKLKERPYDLVISDMGRPPDQQAGYTLLAAVREQGLDVPFIIYAGSRSPEHQQMARERGALGTTNSPQELIALVLEAAVRSRSRERRRA